MRFQFSLATLLVCVTVLAIVIAAATRIDVCEADPTRPAVRLSRSISRQPHHNRPPNATEIGSRLAWSAPPALLLTFGVPWCIRFRPRFSLAALIALIVFLCVWIGFEVYRVQERKRWLSRIDADGGAIHFGDWFRAKYPQLAWEAPPEAYWLRRLLGDRAVYDIGFVVSDYDDRTKLESQLVPVKTIFPEAIVGALVKPGSNLPTDSDMK